MQCARTKCEWSYLILVHFIFFSYLISWQSVEGNGEENFYPNHQDCGNTKNEDPSDVRTLSPWTAAIFFKKNADSPFQYFVTGAIIGETTILSIFGGGFGYPPVSSKSTKQRQYSILPPNQYLVATGLSSTNLDDRDKFTQISQVTFIDPSRIDNQENTDYHFVVFRLKTPLNFDGSHVRPVCIQFALYPLLKSVGFEGTYTEIITLKDEISSMGGYNVPSKLTGSAPLKFLPSLSSIEETCINNYKYHYKSKPDWILCVRARLKRRSQVKFRQVAVAVSADEEEEQGILNATCFTHGSLALWKTTAQAISFLPAYGPSPRWHLSGLVALVPRKSRRQCNINTTYFVAVTHNANSWIKNHLICPPETFPCLKGGKCIPLHEVCDSKADCEDASDENTIFCDATYRCGGGVGKVSAAEKNRYYQCGFEGKCISKSQVGDGVRNCPQGNDEDSKIVAIIKGGKPSKEQNYPNETSAIAETCFPIVVGEGVAADCYDPETNALVSCVKAKVGTMATLSCTEFYVSTRQSNILNMHCNSEGKWVPFRRFSCQPDCGLFGTDTNQALIVNGQVATADRNFPWHAAILRKHENGSNQFKYTCGASLIERNVLLTAAHCITDKDGKLLPFKDFQVVLNAVNDEESEDLVYDEETKIFNVEDSWIPWSFNPLTLDSDIAIMKIDNPVTYSKAVRPICYLLKSFENFPAPKSKGKVPGYGVTETGKISAQLKYVELEVSTTTECNLGASSNIFCAKSADGLSAPSQGDSGGGFIQTAKRLYSSSVSTSSVRHVIKGIVSSRRGDKDMNPSLATGTTRFIHVDSYGEWILNTLENIDTNPDLIQPSEDAPSKIPFG